METLLTSNITASFYTTKVTEERVDRSEKSHATKTVWWAKKWDVGKTKENIY